MGAALAAELTGLVLDSLRIAGRGLGLVEAGFARTDVGAFADPYLAGNPGAGASAPFRAVFDYAERRVSLRPREVEDR